VISGYQSQVFREFLEKISPHPKPNKNLEKWKQLFLFYRWL